jgi:hypothetical protein
MRLWHLIFVTMLAACVLTAARSDAGRVAIVVFAVGLAEMFCGTTAILALFRTVGAIGEAKSVATYAVAMVATVLVVFFASILMNGLLWLGIALLQRVVT